jgi:hypothetical protein
LQAEKEAIMAVAQTDLDQLNDAIGQVRKAVEGVIAAMAAGDSIVYNPAPDAVAIVDEAVGTAASNGETKGDFSLDFPVDALADVTEVKVGAAVHAVVTDFTSGDQVKVEVGEAEDGGDLTFDSAKTGAILASYTPGVGVETRDRARRFTIEDETVGYVTSAGNNVRAKENLLAMFNQGHFTL